MRITLDIIEKGTVIGAAIAAVLPLYQWYDERSGRELERVSSLVIGGQACAEWVISHDVRATVDVLENAPEDVVTAAVNRADFALNMSILCGKLLDHLHMGMEKLDLSRAEEEAMRWSGFPHEDEY
ncbi:hypothetical protein [Ruegeria lacuscaerulensis]|uniref:hypothetical protein n=1 Tax=Ruegeria lacuscaerulensis TaxID=55218 RepID=UPI00147C8F37|nr:hypothetical protein [Ruegeria lacuscaerulensis]